MANEIFFFISSEISINKEHIKTGMQYLLVIK
jgi:hypothetical protein